MRQSGLIHSRSTERSVLISGLLLLLIPGGILLSNVRIADFFVFSTDLLSLSPIGEVIRPDKIVRRRGEDDVAFATINSGDPVFVGDTIITGKDSSTRIDLSDGGTLEVGPESMIKITPVRSFSFKGIQKKFDITVQSGSVKASTKDSSYPFVFKDLLGSIIKEVTPTEPRLTNSISDPQDSDASKMRNPDLATKENYVLVEAPRPEDLPSSRKSPAPPLALPGSKGLTQAPSAPNTLPPLTPALLREAGTAKMIQDFLSNLEPDDSELKNKAQGEDSGSQPLLTRFFAPLQNVPDIEVDPLPPTTIISEEADLKDQHLIFRWKDVGFRLRPPYVLKIQHKDILQSHETPLTEYQWSLPYEEEGRVVWWVEASLLDGVKIESAKQEASWKLPTPILASPGNNLELPEFYLKGETHEVLLTWKQMKICKSFELNVSKNRDFKSLEFKAVTPKNFHTFPVMKPGRYFWRVGCAYTKDFKAFSKPFSFTLSRLK
ncbi:MAG: hypothetical protein KGP28_11195 [Bdellovibrionales bacterium]|nr:hypothetical protein [Bdellovibrionales bacterium]